MLKYKIFSFIVFIVFCGKFAASAGLQRDRRQESARDQDDETREPVKYDGAQLWRIPISNEVERNAVAELETKYGRYKSICSSDHTFATAIRTGVICTSMNSISIQWQ